MDSLYIQDLEVWTRIGVPNEERANEQRLLVSIELFLDLAPAAKTDDVSKSIDYALVASDVRALAGTSRKTLERFAEDTATMILKTYAPAGGVKVSIQKFILPDTKAVCLTIFRS
jgi:FolB domain-containing protein